MRVLALTVAIAIVAVPGVTVKAEDDPAQIVPAAVDVNDHVPEPITIAPAGPLPLAKEPADIFLLPSFRVPERMFKLEALEMVRLSCSV